MKNLSKNILQMDNKEAKSFFLKSESYFTAKLPEYVDFTDAISSAKKILTSKNGQPKDINYITDKTEYPKRDDLNYTLLISKDSNYSWRPLTLLHPILYVDLVNLITDETNWKSIKNRFDEFRSDPRIECYSIPIKALDKSSKTDTGETILNWWENIEQSSLSQSIKYKYCMFTDISNCYPSIYTHSITWAMHEKEVVKADKKYCKDSLGDKIDKKISKMQHNQTNGIPQGSVLMDFIAEIVLGYADKMFSEEINKLSGLEDFKILRYRDDYRIFSNNYNDLERITKVLSDVLLVLNFKLNSNKTKLSDNIIIDSIKEDKLYWNQIKASIRFIGPSLDGSDSILFSINMQKHLLEIKKLADKFPNCGQLKNALSEFYKERVYKLTTRPKDNLPMIGILVDIMVNNSNALPQCILIIGHLLQFEESLTDRKIVLNIIDRYKNKVNTDYLFIWLQRLSGLLGPKLIKESSSVLVLKIDDPVNRQLFVTDWLYENQQSKFNEGTITDKDKFEKMSHRIYPHEVDDFSNYSF